MKTNSLFKTLAVGTAVLTLGSLCGGE